MVGLRLSSTIPTRSILEYFAQFYLQYTKERARREKFWSFLTEMLLKLHFKSEI